MNMFKSTKAKTPKEYIDGIKDPRKSDIKRLDDFIRKTLPNQKSFIISGMIGYGAYNYKSKSGREGEWALVLLASQKNYISIYVCAADGKEYVAEKYKNDLPKTSIGKSCIRVKKMDDLDFKILGKILKETEKLGGIGKI